MFRPQIAVRFDDPTLQDAGVEQFLSLFEEMALGGMHVTHLADRQLVRRLAQLGLVRLNVADKTFAIFRESDLDAIRLLVEMA